MKTNTAIMTMVIAMVAMIGMTGLAMADSDTTTTYNGDGSYDMTYTGTGGGLFTAVTVTSVGYDHVHIDYDADMSGWQAMQTSGSSWSQVTDIDRDTRTDDGYGIITTLSKDTGGFVDNMIGTSVESDNHAKIIDQDVGIASYGVNVVTYHAAADGGAMRADASGGSIIGNVYDVGVILDAEDHSVLYTDASAAWGDSRVDFDTDMDNRGLLYGGTNGDGQLVVYTDTEENFGQELRGTYDSTTFTVNVDNGYNGHLQTVVDFDSTCDVDGYGATSYWYSVNV